jgi:hypothetical protein
MKTYNNRIQQNCARDIEGQVWQSADSERYVKEMISLIKREDFS